MHYTYTTYNLQAMVLQSTDYAYTTYDSQAILLKATPTIRQPISN